MIIVMWEGLEGFFEADLFFFPSDNVIAENIINCTEPVLS